MKNKKVLLVIIIIILLVITSLVDSNMRIVITEYELHYENLPGSFEGFRIAVLADIHDTEFGMNNERLISKVRDSKPDIITIVGDLLNAYENKRPLEDQLLRVEELIIGFHTIAPIYFVTGNHEMSPRIGGPDELLSILNEYSVHVLRNEYKYIEFENNFFVLGGVDGKTGSVAQREAELFIKKMAESEDKSFIVLLEHRNQNIKLYNKFNIDLILSGHSHGGVIRLPFTDGIIGPDRDWFPTFTSGIYTAGETNMLVSRGLGNPSSWPRFLNNPQIAVAILRSA